MFVGFTFKTLVHEFCGFLIFGVLYMVAVKNGFRSKGSHI